MFFQPADTVKYTVTDLVSLGAVQLIEAQATTPHPAKRINAAPSKAKTTTRGTAPPNASASLMPNANESH